MKKGDFIVKKGRLKDKKWGERRCILTEMGGKVIKINYVTH